MAGKLSGLDVLGKPLNPTGKKAEDAQTMAKESPDPDDQWATTPVAQLFTRTRISVVALVAVLKSMGKEEIIRICADNYEKLALWDRGLSVANGDLDRILAQARELRERVLEILLRIGTAVLNALELWPKLLNQNLKEQCSSLRFLLDLTDAMLRGSRTGEFKDNSSPANFPAPDMHLGQLMEEISDYVDCLLDLAPSLDNPALDLEANKPSQPTAIFPGSLTSSVEEHPILHAEQIRGSYVSTPNQDAVYERAIAEFKVILRRRDVEDFRTTTLENLKTHIASLQARQHAQRRQQDLTRLQPFLDAIEQYGIVMSDLDRNSEIVAFIWGPLKLLLQTTSINDSAFGEILNAYGQLGEELPRLAEFQELFRVRPDVARVPGLIYEDILMFQCIVLRYFQQPQWQRLFQDSWMSCKSRFSSIFRDIGQYRGLIERQATSSQIEETWGSIRQSRQAENDRLDMQDWQRLVDVREWLNPTDVEIDQAKFLEARADYPGTGKWLLEHPVFKEWFHPQYAAIPPLLWLSGIPGAGKTMLASLVVQQVSMLKPEPVVLYFYFKHENTERSSFIGLGRSLLAQLLHHDSTLLPTFHQRCCRSGEVVLSSPILLEELLTLAFRNCKSAYIILDGLDECPREQRKLITRWFRALVDNLPNKEADRLRCLFVSQDDGVARKDFAGIASIRITAEDTQHDITEYCRVQARKLLENKLNLPIKMVDRIATTVADSVQGHFLLARLIWSNLSNQESIAMIEEELSPNVLPKTITDAYRRIMVKIRAQSSHAAVNDVSRLLSWLTCAKRSLKWHEIQLMNSIDPEEQFITLECRIFAESSKALLSSLVETRVDGSVEFCHLTVKFFLLEEGYVVPSNEELKLALLCIDYLKLPAFSHPPTQVRVRNGDYGFMEYAVLFWLPHLEAGLAYKNGDESLMADLADSLEDFINQHWKVTSTEFTLAKRHSEKLQYFKELPFYNQLEQAIASTKQQLRSSDNLKIEDNALSFAHTIRHVRKLLEHTITADLGHNDQQIIAARYGTNLFKCPRFSCQSFTVGFSSAVERDKHVSKHERPFRCSNDACVGYASAFVSAAEREKHMRENHVGVTIWDGEFPTQEDIDRSIMNHQNEAKSSQLSGPRLNDDIIGRAARHGWRDDVPDVESEAEPQYQRPSKRARQTEFKCPYCSIVYKKRYNLQSHLLSHESEQPHASTSFAGPSELKRSMNAQTSAKSFVCSGVLDNGNSWGCGRSFARADLLKKHHESRTGLACIQPVLQERMEIE